MSRVPARYPSCSGAQSLFTGLRADQRRTRVPKPAAGVLGRSRPGSRSLASAAASEFKASVESYRLAVRSGRVGLGVKACPGSPIHKSPRVHAVPDTSTRSFAPRAPTGCIGIAWSARPRANLPPGGPTRFARSPPSTFVRIASVDAASSTSERLGVRARPEHGTARAAQGMSRWRESGLRCLLSSGVPARVANVRHSP
jgi:hypothetical protein